MNAPRLSAALLGEILATPARAHRIALVGALALPCPLDHAADYHAWLDADRHGGLEYMARDPEDRLDPTRARPWARSLLVFAQRYTNGWPADDREAEEGCGGGRPWLAGVSRYARGADYHDVLRGAIRRLTVHLREDLHRRGLIADQAELRCEDAVDAGPYLETEYAWRAGLGFIGKNTLLIHPTLGSGLFLGVAITNLELMGLEDAPRPLIGPPASRRMSLEGMASLCGRCTACLDACPSRAFSAPYVLDAGACLSTWSIERRGGAPAERRAEQGGRLFGCDVCQQVCPWNRKAARYGHDDPPEAYAPSPALAELDLADLIRLDADGFRTRFRRSPLWRCHPEGLRRNVLTVAANTGRRDLVEAVRAAADDDPDPGVRELARWALDVLEADS